MEIVILWMIFLSFVAALVIFAMALANAYKDTKAERGLQAKPLKLSDDKLLLSRWELNRRLAEMRREQKRLGW